MPALNSDELQSLTIPHDVKPEDYFAMMATDQHDGRDVVEVTKQVWNLLLNRLGKLQAVADAARRYVALQNTAAPGPNAYATAKKNLRVGLEDALRALPTE